MRKLDLSGDYRAHAVNIQTAWANKIIEKRHVLSRYFEALASDLIDPSHLMFTTTGSDGRLENKAHPGARSNLELQITVTDSWSLVDMNALIERTQLLVGLNLENVEITKVGTDHLSLYQNNPSLVFPTRFFDSAAFFDPGSIRAQVLKWISGEIMNEGRLSSKMYDRFRTHKKMMESGMDKIHWARYRSYDLTTGEVFYDPLNHAFWVKNGPLRYVQYLLAVSLMRYIRDGKAHPSFMDELPPNINDRLTFIQDNSLTRKNSEEVEHLKEIYTFFLYMYHEMQYRHFSEGVTHFVVSDKDMLSNINDMICCLQSAYRIEQFYPQRISSRVPQD